ncbi:MAG: hypothetical protein JWN24_964 [Phycisphaerales bacterium]|nr:hypothetical protein [Phycisphaerales bacterium]
MLRRLITALIIALAFGPILCAADRPADGNAKADSQFKGSPLAQQATTKYEQDVEAARKEYEKKVALLRQDLEKKVDSSRKLYATALKTAQSDATKADKLELAVAIKQAIQDLSAPLNLSWPDILPTNSVVPQIADNAPEQGVSKKMRSIQTFPLNDEKATKKFWNVGDEWQFTGTGLSLGVNQGKAVLESIHSFKGDIALDFIFEKGEGGAGYGTGIDFAIFGETFTFTDWGSRPSQSSGQAIQ